MHGATQWCVMGQSFVGATSVLMAKFNPTDVWNLVQTEKVNSIMITGDAMGKRTTSSRSRDDGVDYDLSTLLAVVSSAALFSAPVKDQFFRSLPNIVITDAIGSSEGGNNGMTVVTAGNTAMKSGPTVHLLGQTVVFDEDLNEVEPGSGVIGKIARSGDIPVGYYNDPKKTAEVFQTVRGTRYVMPGDYATVEADGSITLLGRGSIVINSGGEKIFPRRGRASRPCARTPMSWTPSCAVPPTKRWGPGRWRPSSSPGSATRPHRSEQHSGPLPQLHRGLQAAPAPPRGRRHRTIAQRQAGLHLGCGHRHRGRRAAPGRAPLN